MNDEKIVKQMSEMLTHRPLAAALRQSEGNDIANGAHPAPGLTDDSIAGSRSGSTVVKPDDASARPVEIGGQTGPEPTRYGDWEKRGRCTDF